MSEMTESSPFRDDLRLCMREIRDIHYNPHAHAPAEELDRLVAELDARLVGETDPCRFLGQLQILLARLGDAHTSAYGKWPARRYPIWLSWLDDGWRISACAAGMKDRLLGAEIVGINGRPMKEVADAFFTMISADNNHWRRRQLNYAIMSPVNWEILGLARPDGVLHILLEDGEVTVEPTDRIEWARPPAHPVTGKKNPWFHREMFPEHSLCYMQFNQFCDRRIRPVMNGQTSPDWGDFVLETFAEVERLGLRNLVLDLRHNGGGNSMLGSQLLYCCKLPDRFLDDAVRICYSPRLVEGDNWNNWRADLAHKHHLDESEITLPFREPEFDHADLEPVTHEAYFRDVANPEDDFHIERPEKLFDGRLILLVGPDSYSASSSMAAFCQDNGFAVLYGEPTGGKPTCFCDVVSLRLENSGIILQVSAKEFRRPDPRRDPADCVTPDVLVFPTTTDAMAGADPVWDRLLGDIAANRVPLPRLNPLTTV
jgi:hypothetical protein